MKCFRFALLFALVSQFHIIGCQNPTTIPGLVATCLHSVGKCFAFPGKEMLRSDAFQLCKEHGMGLATVESKEEELFLVDEMRKRGITEVYIDGLVDRPSYWRWTDGTPLQHQGCYSLSSAHWSPQGTAKDLEECKTKAYLKLKFYAIKADGFCVSGKSYIPKSYANCTCPPPSLLGICPKNILDYQVYSYYSDPDGSSWSVGYPSGSMAWDNCLTTHAESGRWINVDCRKKRGYICDTTDFDECADKVAGCVEVYTRDPLTWFAAKYMCESSRGRLVQITNSRIQDAVMMALSKIEKSAENQFWIGASNRKWKWSDETDLSYTNWLTGEPSASSLLSVISLRENGWKVNSGVPQRAACMSRFNLTVETTTSTMESSSAPQVPQSSSVPEGDGTSSSTQSPVEETGTTTTTAGGEMDTTTLHGRHSTENEVDVTLTPVYVAPTTHPDTVTPDTVTADTVTATTWFPDAGGVQSHQYSSERQSYIAVGVVLAILIVIVVSLTVFFYQRRIKANSMKTEDAKGFKFTNRVFYHKQSKNVKEAPAGSPAHTDNDYTTDIYDLPTEIGAICDEEMGDLSSMKVRGDERGFTNLAYGCAVANDPPTIASPTGSSNSKTEIPMSESSLYDNETSVKAPSQIDECQYDYVLN